MTTIATAKAFPITGPLPRAPRYSLLSVAQGFPSDAWRRGVAVEPYPPGVPQAIDACVDLEGTFATKDTPDAVVMVHYAANRPVGALRGESDLAPLLRWLARYSAWLEDRARLNRFRTSFVYVVKARFAGETERRARQQMLAASPPTPGSFLVTDESESWETLSPRAGNGLRPRQ